MGIFSRRERGQQQGSRTQGDPGQRGELVRQDAQQPMMRDPFQVIREVMADPFRMLQMSPWGMFGGEFGWNPGFEVRETDDALVFKADMPGIQTEDLDISLTGDQLVISGKREHEQEQDEGQFGTYERSYGSFMRSFSLPESADVDNIRSELKDGVLTLVVPKKPGSTPPRRKIQIGSGSRT